MNLLFDLDGTLADPQQGILASMRYAFAKLQLPCPEESVLQAAIGPPLHIGFAEMLGTDDEQLAWDAVQAYRECFREVGITGNTVYEGIAPALDELAGAGHRLYLATSKPIVFAAEIISHHGLASFFQGAYGSELDGTRSDKAELIAHILDAEQLDAQDTAMIGDRRHDMVGAIANNVFPVGVLWGFGNHDELSGSGARQVLRHPHALANVPGFVGV